MSEPTYTIRPAGTLLYTISADGTAITCGRCGLVSYHPMDVSTLYCGNCRMFHQPHIGEDALSADALLNEVARLQAENAALRAELSKRAEMDAEDMHRLQNYCAAQLRAAENVVHAARAVCRNAAEANVTRLAMALDAYDHAVKARSV